MINIHANIRGIAVAVPKEKLDLQSLGDLFGEKSIRRIMKSTGIREVRIAPPNQTAADYCVTAADALINRLGISRDEIDGLIFVTQTPDYIAPHTSAIIQDRLKLSNQTLALDINLGCTGFATGILQASMMIESGFCSRVLLLAGDTLTRKINPLDRSQRMVFGDAGSATLIEKSNLEMNFSTYVDGSRSDRLIIPAGGSRIPHQAGVTDITVESEDGSQRSQEDQFMDGMALLNFVIQTVPPVIQDVLEKSRWQIEDVDLFALHQANRSIVNHVAKLLNLSTDKVPFSIEDIGNGVSASIPVLLTKDFAGQTSNLKKVVVCGFGSGLACTAVTTDLSQTNILPILEV